jgi:hypothetical protein
MAGKMSKRGNQKEEFFSIQREKKLEFFQSLNAFSGTCGLYYKHILTIVSDDRK